MKFPGRRNTKHYFPVEEKVRTSFEEEADVLNRVHVVGIDQLLVDIEIFVEDSFLEKYGLDKGQSVIVDDGVAEEIYHYAKEKKLIKGEFPGGAVGNTMHNYSVLSDSPSVILGAIKKQIEVGDYAYKYICSTSSKVNLSFLTPSSKPMGRALCLVTPDFERTFAIAKGCMDELSPESIPLKVIETSAGLLVSAYTFRNESLPVHQATVKAATFCKEQGVPVILSLGSSEVVKHCKDSIEKFIKDFVTILAMNMSEAQELTGINDPLLVCDNLLEKVDLILLTDGAKGMYVAGWIDEEHARLTKEPLHTKSIIDYNKYEYSRGMKKSECRNPIKNYTHINPFMGGPLVIKNTNGAGDAALAALMHDLAANRYHQIRVPNSPKHQASFLTYSSLSQISKYANRASFEVLSQNSPRLSKGLPEREDCLEEAYWSK